MISPSKASKRLGIVGAAAVVGLVPVSFLATPAFAASNAQLTVSPSTVASTSQVVDSFVTGAPLAANGTITATTAASSGCPVGLPVANTSYTVTFTPAGSSTPTTLPSSAAATSNTLAACTVGTGTTYNATTNAGTVTITVPAGTSIPSGSTVTITANGAQNPTNASSVYFNDVSGAESAISTNTVSITTSSASTPGVSAVNPTAYTDAAGEPFTVTGTNFSTAYSASTTTPSPVVCFVESTTAAPSATPTGANTYPCETATTGTGALAGVTTSTPATVTAASSTEIQGTSPALTAGHNYNVVVYNYNGAATPPAYTAASGTSSQTLVGVASNLNVVPESGVRVVDSRSGVNLPKGNLTPGTPTAIPLSAFAQSLSMPTNLPGSYSGLALNVTAVAPADSGNVQVWNAAAGTCPNGLTAGAVKPATVNFQQPQDTNNAQFIPITTGSTGELCVQDNGAPVSLVMDLVGYTTSTLKVPVPGAVAPGGPASYQAPAGTTRVLDTRTGSGGLLGPLQSGTVYQFNAANAGLAPGSTVALNVAAVAPSAAGNLRVFPQTSSTPPAAADVPNTAVDNYIVNTDSSAELVTTIPASGILDIYSAGTGTVNVVIDELGTFTGALSPNGGTPGNTAASIHTLAQPFRIYDSRPGPIPAAGTVTVTGSPSGSGANFVPSNALGLVGNLSDINPAGPGYLVTYPAGGTVPGTASVANFPLQTRNTNNAVALNPSNGSFSIYAGGAATNTTYDASAWIG